MAERSLLAEEDDSLCVVESFPLFFESAEAADHAFHVARARRILEMLLLIDDVLPHDRHLEGGGAPELSHLEARCELLLELVSQLLALQQSMPPTYAVTLCPEYVEWTAGKNRPQEGETGLLHMHLPQCPQLPVIIPVSITTSHENLLQARFEASSTPLKDALQRLIFRHHRRTVARARQHSSATPGT